MPSFADHAASRRKFLQFLAASPLWRAHWTLLPAKGLRPAASFPIR